MQPPRPARDAITGALPEDACDPLLQERHPMLIKKYGSSLMSETDRLVEIDQVQDRQTLENAEVIDPRNVERLNGIDAALDGIAKAIRELRALRPR